MTWSTELPWRLAAIDAHRHAEQHADDDAERRHFERRRKDPLQVVGDRLAGRDRDAEIALQHVADIVDELDQQRLVEAHLDARRFVDGRRRAVADDRQHRIDRHDAADEEGDGEQPEEGQRHRDRRSRRGSTRDAMRPATGQAGRVQRECVRVAAVSGSNATRLCFSFLTPVVARLRPANLGLPRCLQRFQLGPYKKLCLYQKNFGEGKACLQRSAELPHRFSPRSAR